MSLHNIIGSLQLIVVARQVIICWWCNGVGVNWIQLSVILLSLLTDVSVSSGFMFIGIIPFELDDCLLYHDISAGGRDPHETHPRWYSRPATRGWTSVMIFAPKGTDNHLIVIHLIIRMHYLHIISNETKDSLGIVIFLLGTYLPGPTLYM